MVIKLHDQWETEQPFNLLSWGHWFTFANLLLALFISAFYVVEHTLPTTFAGWLYFLTTWIGHFAFLSLSSFIISIFPVVVLFPYKRHIRGVSAIMASLFQLYLVLDVLAYRGLGYHLTASSFDQISEVEDVYVGMMGDSYFVMVLAMFIGILTYEFLVSNYTWKRIQRLQEYAHRYKVVALLIFSFMFSHFMHIWADATLNNDIAKQGSMFPAHYPLTAKTLLARYELIDLEEYNSSKSQQALINSSKYDVTETQAVTCEIDNKPKLMVTLMPLENKVAVEDWLQYNNINYKASNQLSIPKDLDTLLFNFKTGLPGLYQSAEQNLNINKHLADGLIAVEVLESEFDAKQTPSHLNAKRAIVFYDTATNEVFYRTHAFLIGFNDVPDMSFSPQNIIASYLATGINCPEYVDKNLIDNPFSEFDYEHITTNFSGEHFYFVSKDNALLFKRGQLVKNVAYSTNKTIKNSVDIYVLEQAATRLTKRRVKVPVSK